MKVGCNLPTEQSWRVILQAAVVAGLELHDETTSVALLRQMKTMLRKKPVVVPRHLVRFPPKPHDLEWFSTAYTAEDPPHQLDESEVLKQDVTLRVSGKNVDKSRASGSLGSKALTVHNTGAAPSRPSEGPSQEMWAHMGAMMMQMMMHGGSANPNSANIQLTKKHKRLEDGAAEQQGGTDQPLALTDKTLAAGNVPPEPSKGPDDSAAEKAPAHEAQPQGNAVLLSLPENQPSMKKPAAATAGKPKAKAKSSSKGSGKAKLKAKAKTKSIAKAGGSGSGKAGRKGLKPKSITRCKNGWRIDERVRESGQKDKHYISPDGKMFRTLTSATEAGFVG